MASFNTWPEVRMAVIDDFQKIRSLDIFCTQCHGSISHSDSANKGTVLFCGHILHEKCAEELANGEVPHRDADHEQCSNQFPHCRCDAAFALPSSRGEVLFSPYTEREQGQLSRCCKTHHLEEILSVMCVLHKDAIGMNRADSSLVVYSTDGTKMCCMKNNNVLSYRPFCPCMTDGVHNVPGFEGNADVLMFTLSQDLGGSWEGHGWDEKVGEFRTGLVIRQRTCWGCDIDAWLYGDDDEASVCTESVGLSDEDVAAVRDCELDNIQERVDFEDWVMEMQAWIADGRGVDGVLRVRNPDDDGEALSGAMKHLDLDADGVSLGSTSDDEGFVGAEVGLVEGLQFWHSSMFRRGYISPYSAFPRGESATDDDNGESDS